MPKIALLQMTSGIDPEENFETICRAMGDARAGGAEMLFTPEMSLLLDRDRDRASGHIRDEEDRALFDRLRLAAQEHEIWLTAGVPVRRASGRMANRQWLFAPSGEPLGHYDKMHMFDVELASGESWRESAAYEPGRAIYTMEDTPVGRLGLTICYDLRFPALFDALGQRRCDAIAVPAAFTVPTGEAHWHVLLRARAIEASAFVIAAAQVGRHADGRKTYGHSLVVDPWGEVLLDMGGAEPGLELCNIDMRKVEEVRSQIPSLANRQEIFN